MISLIEKLKKERFSLSSDEFSLLNVTFEEGISLCVDGKYFQLSKKGESFHFLKIEKQDDAVHARLPVVSEIYRKGSIKFVVDPTLVYLVQHPRVDDVWFDLNPTFLNVKKFWGELKRFYQDKPSELDKKFRVEYNNTQVVEALKTVSSREIQVTSIMDDLAERIKKLEKSRANTFAQLQQSVHMGGGDVEMDDERQTEHINLLKRHETEDDEVKRLRLNYSSYQDKIAKLSKDYSYSDIKFFVSVFGQKHVVERYEEFIGDNIISLNHQLHEITKRYESVEKGIFALTAAVHTARKEHARDEFQLTNKLLEEKASKVADDSLSKEHEVFMKANAQHTSLLRADIAHIHLACAEIQEKIDKERESLSYLDRSLSSIDIVDNYSQRVKKLRDEKTTLLSGIAEMKKDIDVLYSRVHTSREHGTKFLTSSEDNYQQFLKEVLREKGDYLSLSKDSVSSLWSQFSENLSTLSNGMIVKHKQDVTMLAEIVVAQSQKLNEIQCRVLEYVQMRQCEWEHVLEEIKIEFKVKGYYLEDPQETEIDCKHIREIRRDRLKITPQTKRLLMPISPKNMKLSQYKDPLIGLEPKTNDDSDYAVIDQVWAKLTPEQEERLTRQTKKADEVRNAEIKDANLLALRNRYEEKMAIIRKSTSLPPIPMAFAPITDNVDEEEIESFSRLESIFLEKDGLVKKTISHTLGKFREDILYFSKKLLDEKQASMMNFQLLINNDGFVKDSRSVVYTRADFFTAPPKDLMIEDDLGQLDLCTNDHYEEPSEEYFRSIESYEELLSTSDTSPRGPNLPELAHLSYKRYRDELENKDIRKLKTSLKFLDDEVQKIKNCYDGLETKLSVFEEQRRNIYEMIKVEKATMFRFLSEKDKELESIIFDAEKKLSIDLSIIDKAFVAKSKDDPTFWKKFFS